MSRCRPHCPGKADQISEFLADGETPDPALFLGQSPEFSERRLMAEAPVPGKTAKTRKTPRNQRISRRWRNSSFRTRSGLQSSPLLKPDLSAHFQWRTSRAACRCAPVSRFIFVGNQPKIVNGEAMELLGRGCRNTDPDYRPCHLPICRWRKLRRTPAAGKEPAFVRQSVMEKAMENARNLGTLDCFPKSISGSDGECTQLGNS